MAKPDLGSKRQCENCGTKFFDLNKDPILCPKCGTTFQVVTAAPPARGPSRAAPKDDEDTETEDDPRTVSLEDADQVEDGKVEAASTDDDEPSEDDDDTTTDDDDTFLEDDDDDDDVSDLVEGGDEDEDER